ncbi:hypothetical protein BGX38DRAFT_1330169 [Terfezia claveryi]|nr:hypothetical protein BGX38DRAFT_1330169 [Terfezia claveryi]
MTTLPQNIKVEYLLMFNGTPEDLQQFDASVRLCLLTQNFPLYYGGWVKSEPDNDYDLCADIATMFEGATLTWWDDYDARADNPWKKHESVSRAFRMADARPWKKLYSAHTRSQLNCAREGHVAKDCKIALDISRTQKSSTSSQNARECRSIDIASSVWVVNSVADCVNEDSDEHSVSSAENPDFPVLPIWNAKHKRVRMEEVVLAGAETIFHISVPGLHQYFTLDTHQILGLSVRISRISRTSLHYIGNHTHHHLSLSRFLSISTLNISTRTFEALV